MNQNDIDNKSEKIKIKMMYLILMAIMAYFIGAAIKNSNPSNV